MINVPLQISPPARPSSDWLEVDRRGRVVSLRCTATSMLESETVHRLHRAVEKLLQPGIRRLELDFAAIDSCDTKLVACLILALREARRHGIHLVIHPSGALLQLIRLCGLDTIVQLRVHENGQREEDWDDAGPDLN